MYFLSNSPKKATTDQYNNHDCFIQHKSINSACSSIPEWIFIFQKTFRAIPLASIVFGIPDRVPNSISSIGRQPNFQISKSWTFYIELWGFHLQSLKWTEELSHVYSDGSLDTLTDVVVVGNLNMLDW